MTTPARPSNLPTLSRRDLLRLAGGLAGGAALGSALHPGRAHAAVATPLHEPEVLRSRGGVLDVTLRAQETSVQVGDRRYRMMTYNGQLPGPTLVVHPGDVLRVRLVNELDAPTNLHTHGLHVSGEGNADNVFVRVDPGESFDYEIPIRHDHHTGTNWYHPHFHGTGAQQVFAGLAGVLVVEGREQQPRSIGIDRDRVLALTATQFDDSGEVVPALSSGQAAQVRLVNGQLDPTIDIRPGEVQRWRLVNTSVNNVIRVALDGHTMTRVAADGNPYRQAVEVDEVVLASGQRADVLVRGGDPGSSALRVLPYDIGFGVVVPEARLATLVCSGRPTTARRPLRLDPLLSPLEDLRDHAVDVRRELAMTMAGGFGIDGKRFDPERVDQLCELDAVEEWTVHNPTGLVHPFHIHVNPFQVTHVNGIPVDSPSREDTVIVDKNGGSITFRTRFEDFTGTAIYHCHFVTHAELGMMGIAEVVDPALPVPTDIDPTGPWSCTITPPEGTVPVPGVDGAV
ncbi:multicopper oxidase family protein [Salsipaludibacter albus]|uniref:multicopper oxidase family protein n=1 Tax=Salsipaludibacter albus TaxID=2849650 RepID=UPI001EE3C9D3|nr:multicopper oxidase family protein [Salsipaludibacter albus]MBY5162437.1 multicopper oxidase family protein [Salsipaludibacter albus]